LVPVEFVLSHPFAEKAKGWGTVGLPFKR